MKTLFNFILIFLIFSSCISQPETNKSPLSTHNWETADPASVGLNQDSLNQLFQLINDTPPEDFRALIVLKDGKLVVDEYFNSFWITNIHDIRSAGKSVTSMLAGIAMDKGLFKPSSKVFSFFPEYSKIKNKSKIKSEITVEDLLVMSSGLASDDYLDDSPGTEDLMSMAEDYLKFTLDLPPDFEPGERWAYSSAVAFLLGSIVENTSEMTLEDFGRKHLFSPLGIEGFYWDKSPKGRTTGMGNVYFNARDFAKLGQLMLDGGVWNGTQIISKNFVQKSFEKRFDISDNDPFAHGYGYMWYIGKDEIGGKNIDFYFASGNGGNKVFIVPSLNMVVVTLSSAYGQWYGQRRSHRIFRRVLEAAFAN